MIKLCLWIFAQAVYSSVFHLQDCLLLHENFKYKLSRIMYKGQIEENHLFYLNLNMRECCVCYVYEFRFRDLITLLERAMKHYVSPYEMPTLSSFAFHQQQKQQQRELCQTIYISSSILVNIDWILQNFIHRFYSILLYTLLQPTQHNTSLSFILLLFSLSLFTFFNIVQDLCLLFKSFFFYSNAMTLYSIYSTIIE